MTDPKELAQRRRANLKRWMDDNNVGPSDMASRLQVGRAYASLLFNPDRYFGEKAARSIENKLNMPPLFLDSDGKLPIATPSWVSPADLGDGMYGLVPQTRLRPAASAGLVDVHAIDLPPLAFTKSWLTGARVTDSTRLFFGQQAGDSMEPYLGDGDIYMVDAAQTDVADGQVYAMLYGGEIRLRRLSRRFDGGLLLRADNARYPEEKLTTEEAAMVKVVGRVLWRAG